MEDKTQLTIASRGLHSAGLHATPDAHVGVLESSKNKITAEAEMKLPITCNSRARELI